jgi:hypothetical protein
MSDMGTWQSELNISKQNKLYLIKILTMAMLLPFRSIWSSFVMRRPSAVYSLQINEKT